MLRDYGFKEIRNHIERSYKGERRMPRLPAARKDAVSCENVRGSANRS